MKLFELLKKKKLTYENDPNDLPTSKKEFQNLNYLKTQIQALESIVSGVKFVKELEYQKAKECFDFAIENGMEKPIAYKYRGICFQQDDFNYEALNDFNKSILLDPDDWETYYYRKASLDNLKKYEEEVFDLNKVIDLLQQQKDLDDEKSKILSSCQINLKGVIELAEINKQWVNLQNEWENKLKEVRENAGKRKIERNKDSGN